MKIKKFNVVINTQYEENVLCDSFNSKKKAWQLVNAYRRNNHPEARILIKRK